MRLEFIYWLFSYQYAISLKELIVLAVLTNVKATLLVFILTIEGKFN